MSAADANSNPQSAIRNPQLNAAIARCEQIMSHAWMVRTFVKHSPEVEEFPELMEIVRTVFDTSRALETRIDDPAGYLHMLKKKLGKLRKAAEKFRHDAPVASDHTNFKQAVISMDACIAELDAVLRGVVVPAPSTTALDTPQTLTGKTHLEVEEQFE